MTTRPLGTGDAAAAFALGAEAFGYTPEERESPPALPRPGRHEFGSFDDGRLVARVAALELASWFGGVAVPTAGVAAVSVAAEDRGGGRLDEPLRMTLSDARDRGDVLATLFPSAAGIYRRYGFEIVGCLTEADVRTAELPASRPDGVRLRRAGPEDAETVRGLYDDWARAQDGPLSRRTAVFRGSPLDDVTGVTLAEVDGAAAGYLAWHRGHGYDAGSTLRVDDLVGLDPRATGALVTFLAGWSAVAPTVRITTSGQDPLRLSLRGDTWRVVLERPYMLRLLDVAAALSLRPAAVHGSASFAVAADALDPAGSYRLDARDGILTCTDGPSDGPTFTSRGLALWYAGTQDLTNLRMAGLVSGPATYDGLLDRLLVRRPLHIRDYF